MAPTIEFFFDFPSPYSYIAHTQLPRLAAEHGARITYHPFRILNLIAIVGNRPTTIECQNKNKYAGVDLQRWAKRYNVEFARNPHSKGFDFAQFDRGALAAIELGRGGDYVTAIFSAYWAKSVDLSHRPAMMETLERAGFDASQLLERAESPDIVAKLEADTQAAADRGVFGSPTMFLSDQMFFGNDRLDFLAEALRAAQ